MLAPKRPTELSQSVSEAEQAAASFLAAHLRATETDDELATLIDSLLAQSISQQRELDERLSQSQVHLDQLLTRAKSSLSALQKQSGDLHAAYLQAEDDLIDQRNILAPNKSAAPSLMLELASLQKNLKDLETTRSYFTILEQAEEHARHAVKSLEAHQIDLALSSYVQLVGFSGKVAAAASPQPGDALHISQLIEQVAYEILQTLQRMMTASLGGALEKAKWPSAQTDEPAEQEVVEAIRAPFVDALKLQKTADQHPLPHLADPNSRPIIAIAALAGPIILRFRFHFEGQRPTNRLDKPEWFFAHILNALSDQERFLSTEIQHLLNKEGFSNVDAFTDFITVLCETVVRKLRQITPQLLSMPPILAHTIYQALEFDETLRNKYGYAPRGTVEEWPGTVEAILGRQDWLDGWRAAEKKHVDDRYYEIISAANAWQVNEDFGPASSLRPTNSSLRVRDVFDQLTERYRSLPLFAHRLPFWLDIQLPLLQAYHARIASAIDAFETLSFGLMRAVPGALGDTSHNRLTAGVAGLQRIVRAGVSARWMEGVCKNWSEDTFFVEMWSIIRQRASNDARSQEALGAVGSGSSTLFSTQANQFALLAERIDSLMVKHVVREVSTELKSYLGKRWDSINASEDSDPSISPELLSALSTFSALISSLAVSLPAILLQKLYREITQHLTADWLLSRIAMGKVFSQSGGEQFRADFTQGWEVAGRQAGVRQPVAGFQKLQDASILLSLPAGSDGQLGKACQMAWDDDEMRFAEVMQGLQVHNLTRKEVQNVLKRRSEAWQ